MKVNKIIKHKQEVDLEIIGGTLLSTEDIKSLPFDLKVYHGCWWLKTPSDYQNSVTYVYTDGEFYNLGFSVAYHDVFVRPALIINNFSSSIFEIGDIFIFNDKEFEIISDKLAFCKSDIGKCCFREDLCDSDANDYEKSDIKKYINKWFKEACK